ncbi:MAG: T9SS type A sorting domain-containing protein [Ferruginibacter sp.]
MKKLLLFFSCVWCLLNTTAQVGSLDPEFGTNGIVNMPSLKVVPAPDHSFFSVFYSDDNVVTVAKYFSDGTIDASYGTGGYSEDIRMSNFVDAALTDDGKLVLVGVVDVNYEIHWDIEVCRLTSAGFRDPTFNAGQDVTYSANQLSYDKALSLTVSGDMIVLLSLSSSTAGGFTIYQVLNIDVAGNVGYKRLVFIDWSDWDASHRTYEYFLGIQGNQILIAANTYNVNTFQYEYTLSTRDSFDQGPLAILDKTFFSTPLVVQAQGNKILIAGGNYNPITGIHGIAIARYNNDGSLDNSFNGNGMQVTDFGPGITLTARSIAIQGNKIIVGSYFTNPATHNTEFALVRFNNDGTVDNSFDNDGKQTTDLGGSGFLMQQLKVYGNRLFAFGGGVAAAYILEDNSSTITLSCSAGKTVYTDPGVCTALLKEIGPFLAPSPDDSKVNYTLSGATTGSGIGTVSGLVFNKGVTTVTYSVIGSPSQTCTFNVTVKDKAVPVITNLSATPASLWPPNHKMRDVFINYTLTDNCPGVVVFLSVKSNELQTGTGAGDEPNDWQIIDPNHVKLRAERNEHGTGRIYTITIKATDAAGNITKQEVNVTVPLNQGSHKQSYTGSGSMESLQVKVLSNPSKNDFTLQTSSNNNKPMVLRVTNAVGSVVETQSGVPANGQVQVGRNYRDGFYFAELIQGGQKVVVKLVKLR